jgi:hypothetical protein
MAAQPLALKIMEKYLETPYDQCGSNKLLYSAIH